MDNDLFLWPFLQLIESEIKENPGSLIVPTQEEVEIISNLVEEVKE